MTQPADPIATLSERVRVIAGEIGTVPAGIELSRPANADHGDLASPVAMALAKAAKRNPREVAAELLERLQADVAVGDAVAGIEIAGPGFLNLRLHPQWFAATLQTIRQAGSRFGASAEGSGQRFLVEFVSVNPTGPPHTGHARGAAYGDSLCRILEFAGQRVTREYYSNDYGRQMSLFGASVAAAYGQLLGKDTPIPEDGYHGAYVADIAAAMRGEVGDAMDPAAETTIESFAVRAGELMLNGIRSDLARFRVRFDHFFSETDLHASGRVPAAVEALVASGDAYEDDGATWFRTTTYGDDKDRVLRRSTGETTYLAADVAYHLDKAGRGDDVLIDVLGADHHGYIGRLRAVLAAGGFNPDMLEMAIIQLVSLTEAGEAKRMSKRAGTMVTLAELVDDIGVDVARFFLVQRSHETAFDLDLDLAREASQENPVYYVQYVHARVCQILARDDAAAPPAEVPVPDNLEPADRALILTLAAWPAAIREATDRRAPHRIAAQLIETAREFHSWYHHCRVVGVGGDLEVFRLALCEAVRDVVATGLDLLGVSAPERM